MEDTARSPDYTHVGLQGMAERVSLIGGSLDVSSTPGRGTVVAATFPVRPGSTAGI